jgi:dipeptide/tripeptide permease
VTWIDKSFTTLSGIGLGYDIVGAIILAWAILAAGYRDQQRRDLGFGLLLVIVGFAIQFVGAGYSLRLNTASVVFAWLLLVLLTIAYLCLRKRGLKTGI